MMRSLTSLPVGKATLALTTFALGVEAAAVALLLSRIQISYYDGKWKYFTDFDTYRFVLLTAIIGGVYTLVKIPFAVYYAIKEKSLIEERNMPDLEYYGDKVVTVLLATGVGAGLASSFDLKTLINLLLDRSDTDVDSFRNMYNQFYNRAIIASIFLAMGLIALLASSVLPSTHWSRSKALPGQV